MKIQELVLKAYGMQHKRGNSKKMQSYLGDLNIGLGEKCLENCPHFSRECVFEALREGMKCRECGEMAHSPRVTDTLCWCCKKSTGECSWSDGILPTGAVREIVDGNEIVTNCTNFERG